MLPATTFSNPCHFEVSYPRARHVTTDLWKRYGFVILRGGFCVTFMKCYVDQILYEIHSWYRENIFYLVLVVFPKILYVFWRKCSKLTENENPLRNIAGDIWWYRIYLFPSIFLAWTALIIIKLKSLIKNYQFYLAILQCVISFAVKEAYFHTMPLRGKVIANIYLQLPNFTDNVQSAYLVVWLYCKFGFMRILQLIKKI